MCIRDSVWPEAFERMEQFIQDTGLSQEDLNMNYDDVVEMYKSCLLYTSCSK